MSNKPKNLTVSVEYAEGYYLLDQNGKQVAACEDTEEGELEARRMAACINACAPLDTVKLEEGLLQYIATVMQEAITAGEKLLKAYDSLMPGLRHIAVQDYMLINEAPLEMRTVLAKLKGGSDANN